MSTLFTDREKGFETKFKIDQETTFKVEARRNKLLGLPETEHEAYAKDVVLADLKEPGVEDIMRKVTKDVSDRAADLPQSDIRQKLTDLHATAYKQITAK